MRGVIVYVGPANFGHHNRESVNVSVGDGSATIIASYCDPEEVEFLIKQLQLSVEELRRKQKEDK